VSPQQKNRSDLLPWIFSRVPGNLATHIPKDARKVVDLFAGSGRFARAANRRGFDVVYNDVHPLLAAYTKAVRDRDHAKINLAMTEMAMDITNFQAHYRNTYRKPTDLIEAAATARLAAFNAPRGCHLDETEIVKFAPLASDEGASAWANMEVSGLDYRKAIKEHDGRRTTFFVDCPYPGTDYYEHNMSWVEFKTMLRTVRGVRGDVLMVLPTQRRTVEMVADAGFHLHLRLLKTPRFKGRDLVASTRPLPVSDIMTPFDPAEFGLGSRAELDAEVDRVVAVLRDGGAMTRGQLEKALGISRSSTWGALSRARAEGRVVKKGRAKYTTASA
jgi:16S rRNA G966 N2-methylase RsmD